MLIRHQRLQRQRPGMALVHSTVIPRHIHAKLTRIPGIRNINVTYHTTTGTRVTYIRLHGQLQWLVIDVQGLILPSQIITPRHSITIVGMEPHHWLGFATLPIQKRVYKQHSGLSLKVFPNPRWILRQYFSNHPNTTYSGVITHQTAEQRDYILDIFASSILETNKNIFKPTETKQSVNWDIWCKLITHSCVKVKFLDRIPQGYKTTLVSSFSA